MTRDGLTIQGLGPLRVSRDGTSVAIGGLKQRMVLGLLMLNPMHVVSRERFITALWEDAEPGDALGTLQVYVANLRRIIDPDRNSGVDGQLIQSVSPGYLLSVDTDRLDLLAFEDLIARAQQTDHPGSQRTLLLQALELWRGDLLQDLQGHHFLLGEAARWEELRSAAQRDLLRAELALGNHQRLIPDMEQLIALHPYDEDLAALRMLALYRCGRQAEALDTYTKMRDRLVDELGVEPGHSLRQLELQVLNQDPGLDFGSSIPGAPMGATIRASGVDNDGLMASVIVGATEVHLMNLITTLGRQPDRDIVIDDDQVSRRHAEIRRSADRFILANLGSTNGTTLNGEMIDQHALEDGDSIGIGETTITFRLRSLETP